MDNETRRVARTGGTIGHWARVPTQRYVRKSQELRLQRIRTHLLQRGTREMRGTEETEAPLPEKSSRCRVENRHNHNPRNDAPGDLDGDIGSGPEARTKNPALFGQLGSQLQREQLQSDETQQYREEASRSHAQKNRPGLARAGQLKQKKLV